MSEEKIKDLFYKFISDTCGAYDTENEIEYVKALAYRDGVISFMDYILVHFKEQK